ncbi:MAG TPA: DNA polymerase IV, partial [Phycisphaerales bacterium]|nr:DNA polymerase IV [Phycisphaerales bacterium]
AKLASDLKKPDGLVEITPDNAQSVLDALPVTKLWGAGPATAGQFERLNLRTIGQLRRADPRLIARTFGQAGEHFLRLARGEDDRPVTPDSQARSIGQEQTFAVD